jgi:hypothetical protein
LAWLADAADDVHLAALAVELEGEFFLAVDQGHRVGLDAFHFLRTQVEAVAQAVLGDHQRGVVGVLVGLVGGLDEFHAVTVIEGPGLLVEHVGQVAEFGFGVGHRRLDGGARHEARQGGQAGGLERSTASRRRALMAPAGRNHGADSCSSMRPARENRRTQLAKAVLQAAEGAFGILGGLLGVGQAGTGGDAGLVGEGEGEAVGGFGEQYVHGDAAFGGLLFEHALELMVPVAEQAAAREQVGRHGFGGVDAEVFADLLGAVHPQADQFALAVVEAEAVAVVQLDCAGGVEVAALLAVQADHAAAGLADELGRVEGADVGGGGRSRSSRWRPG